MRASVIIGVLALSACSRAVTTTTTAPPRSGSAPAKVDAAPDAAASAAPPVNACAAPKEVDTIDDGEGVMTAMGGMDLGDVQVVADDAKIAVSWTRQSHYATGDSYRAPSFALKTASSSIDAGAGAGFHDVSLPVFSFACATYGTAAVNTVERPFVSWGVLNSTSFEVFDALPKLDSKNMGMAPPLTKPVHDVFTKRQVVDHVVATRDLTAAVLWETKCDRSCECASGEPDKQALWLRSLDRVRPWAQRVSDLHVDSDKLGAPALTMGDPGGVVAYRAKSKLYMAWLDGEGKPQGKAVEFDAGDVGAPAVAMAGPDAVLVWARRASKEADYQLQAIRVKHGATLPAATSIKTVGPAYAPALVADAKSVVLAWMEGDGGKRGEIHMTKLDASLALGADAVMSGAETNARDPELSGTPEQPVLVWQSFTKEKAAGVIKAARTTCTR